MGSFEITEHTADVGISARGGTFAEALAWVAKGMFSVIAELEYVTPKLSIDVSVTAMDRDALVVDWLNELLYWYDGEGYLLTDFDVTVDEDEKSLTARCRGEGVNTNRHVLLTDVKAATYHGLEVTSNGEWRIDVVLDV